MILEYTRLLDAVAMQGSIVVLLTLAFLEYLRTPHMYMNSNTTRQSMSFGLFSQSKGSGPQFLL